jgi:hypothetical protein
MERERGNILTRQMGIGTAEGIDIAIRRILRGEHQEIETLISEEVFLFAKYLRDEKPTWVPRIVGLT